MTNTLFIRLLNQNDKGEALARRIAALREGLADEDVYAVNPESFRQVPNTPFCYWVSERIRRLFKELPPFESDGRTVKQGLATADDFRFVRAWWEVPAERILDGGRYAEESRQDAVGCRQKDQEEKWTEERIRDFQTWCRKRTDKGKRWVPFAKGGEYSPYYADIHLVVNWEKEGVEMKAFSGSVIRNPDYYFRPGLTWPRSTVKGLNMRLLPASCVFADKGPSGFLPALKPVYSVLGLFNSECYQVMVSLQQGSRAWEVGTIQKTAIPLLDNDQKLNKCTLHIWNLKRLLDFGEEISHVFIVPALMTSVESNLTERTTVCRQQFAETEAELSRIQSEVDEVAFDLYGFTTEERRAAGVAQVSAESNLESDVFEGGDGEVELLEADSVQTESAPPASTSDPHVYTADLLSWCVGVVFGRWDVRIALDPSLAPNLPDPFDPLPVCPPGMLVGPDGLPAVPNRIVSEEWLRARPDAGTLPPDGSIKNPIIPDSEYPLRISWDGVLVDDPGHEDDVIRHVQDVLEVIWKDRAEAVEQEACEILGVRELRDYFRKPGNGGFWMDHVKRYSKSRRKAPIYWYLRSARGNYGLWLYYHRLDKDILFKALLNYVEPKIRLEEDRLKSLRARKEAAGSSGREAKQIEKEMDRQEQFVSELRDFEEKLWCVANLHLDFDLNDGLSEYRSVMGTGALERAKEILGSPSGRKIRLVPSPTSSGRNVQEACRKDRSIAMAQGGRPLCS